MHAASLQFRCSYLYTVHLWTDTTRVEVTIEVYKPNKHSKHCDTR